VKPLPISQESLKPLLVATNNRSPVPNMRIIRTSGKQHILEPLLQRNIRSRLKTWVNLYFLKKIILFLLKIKLFLYVLNHFDTLILKII